jgi:hypothetical protein
MKKENIIIWMLVIIMIWQLSITGMMFHFMDIIKEFSSLLINVSDLILMHVKFHQV